jgi:hypothetical protein
MRVSESGFNVGFQMIDIMKTRSVYFFVLLIAIVFFGCAKSNYIGKTYAPTSNVDLYMDVTGINRQYEVMGNISLDGDNLVSSDKLQARMMEEAKKKGADAVLVEVFDEVYTSSTTRTDGTSSTDKKGNQHYHGTSTTSQSKHKILKAKFLKYTD